MDVIVSSFGGVGTSPFLIWLSSQLNCNSPSDLDNLKHVVDPKVVSDNAEKFVYIFGDPVESILSLYRRNHIGSQFTKLTGEYNKITIEEYADSGKDLLNYERQFDNWTNFNCKPVLYLKYPHFWSHEAEILKFLELSNDSILFKKKERTIVKSNFPKKVIEKLELIYKPLNEKMNKFGRCVTR